MGFIKEGMIEVNDIFLMFLYHKKQLNFKDDYLNKLISGGWGNGYVGLPWWHPYYDINYNDVPVIVHGGLTYSSLYEKKDLWVIGFDTNHSGDNLNNCSFDFVKDETYRLMKQCYNIKEVKRIIKLNKIINLNNKPPTN